VIEFKKRETLESLVARRVEFLTAYQNAAYAAQYQASSRRCARRNAAGQDALTESVARYLFKLMAYKDEYEVARLHTDTAFLDKINGMFEGDFKLNYHLAPPLMAKRNDKGELHQAEIRPGDADRFQAAGPPQGPARRRVGHVWPHRRAPRPSAR
jgi:indolepyruvate ferredoxin oxidoreductase